MDQKNSSFHSNRNSLDLAANTTLQNVNAKCNPLLFSVNSTQSTNWHNTAYISIPNLTNPSN